MALIAAAAFGAPADLDRGLAWLQAQVQSQGVLAVQSQVAVQQQARCETAATLLKLAGSNANVVALVASLQEPAADAATESIACWQQLRQQLGETILASDLEARRVAQQGYAPYEGLQVPTALDTGWALAAQLRNLTQADRAIVLGWLRASQGADGSFAAGDQALLASAVVLRALKDEAARSATAGEVAGKVAAWLLAQRNSGGNWLDDTAATALAYEAAHPYTGQDANIAGSVESFLLGRQRTDGSWAGDPYVTALALRALALIPVQPVEPTRSALKLRFVDARTGLAVPGVQLQAAPASISATSNADGSIQLSNVAATTYQLTASANGYATVSTSATLPAGQILDLGTIQLIAAANSSRAVVAGTVREQGTNAPISGVAVAIDGQERTAVTAADGNFLISDVAPGFITVSATKAGYLTAAGTANALGGQMVNFSPWLSQDPGNGSAGDCKITGTVLSASTQQPLAGVMLTVSGGSSASVSTDAVGRFSTPNLASGLIAITATKAGYDSATANAQLACDPRRATVADFSPRLYLSGQSPSDANTASLAGVVMDAATNQPIAAAQLALTSSGGFSRVTQSKTDGSFLFEGLNAVNLQLQVQAAGYGGTTMQYALAPLQALDVGQVRLRAPAVQQLLPDLKVLAVKRGTSATDPQSLEVRGSVDVVIANVGTESASTGVAVTVFHDINQNSSFDAGMDTALGQGVIASVLASGSTTTLTIHVAGTAPFRDAAIHAIVDPASQRPDANRTNNVRSVADDHLLQPQPGQLEPEVKWWWKTTSVQPSSVQVESGILVGPFEDTNADGKLDSRDDTRVLFITYTLPDSEGVLRVLDGRSGKELRSIYRPGGISMSGYPGFAAADVNADGIAEIFVPTLSRQLMSLSPSGQVNWVTNYITGAPSQPYGGGPSVADIDGDGTPEILYGPYVIDARSGAAKWVGTKNVNGAVIGYHSIAADLEGNGEQYVIVGPSAYRANGQLLWERRDIGSGYTAVLKVPNRAGAQIAVAAGGNAYLLDKNGSTIWGPVSVGGRPGAPTIGDFDGDGVPDIGIAGSSRYTALRADGSILWTLATNDGSGQTGSTSFDFDGDGTADVVYGDEDWIRIVDGKTGAVKFKIAQSNGTAGEQPVVADVDNDGHADFLVASDVYFRGSHVGVRAFQGKGNQWIAARPLWNQYAYSITNINDDLTVPPHPAPSWRAHNTFRLNKRIDADPRAVADLTVGYLRVADGGSTGSTLLVRVGNGGSYKVPAGAKFAVYNADPALGVTPSALRGTTTLGAELQPGQWHDLSIPLSGNLATLSAGGRIWIVGDDDGTGKTALVDFDRSNNTIAADLSAVAINLVPSVSTDKPSYTEADQAIFTATVRNLGSYARPAQVRLSVLDGAGNFVEVLPLGPEINVQPAGNANVVGLWPVAGVLSGGYQVLAELVTAQGVVYGSATATFTVSASQAQTAITRIATDRASYTAAQSVQVNSRAANLTANTVQEDLRAVTAVHNASGQQIFTQTETIAQLAPGAQRQYNYGIAASGLAVGSYSANLQLLNAEGTVLSQSSTVFTVLGIDQTGVGLTGQLQAMPSVVLIGQPVALNLAAASSGNAALATVPVTVRIIEPQTGTVIASFSQSVASWPQGTSQNLSWSWTAQGLDGQILVAVVSANVAGRDVSLGQANIRLVGVPQLKAEPAQLDFPPVYAGETGGSYSSTVASVGTTTATSVTLALGGTHPSQFVIPDGGCAQAPSLPIGATCTFSVSYRPSEAGQHSAELRISYDRGADVLIKLTGQAKPIILSGSVAPAPAEIHVGDTTSLAYSLSNPAGVGVTASVSLSVLTEQGQPVTSWPFEAVVGANATTAGNRSYTAQTDPQTLSVVLSQNVAGSNTVLATNTLVVTEIPVKVDPLAAVRTEARILVLVSCPPESGPNDALCVQQRMQGIAGYLDSLGITNKVVSTQAEFKQEMCCGTYNTYWISGGAAKLSAELVGQLRESIWAGESLITDGLHDSRNHLLHGVNGIEHRGKLPASNQNIDIPEGSLYAPGTLPTLGQPLKAQLLPGAKAQAWFSQMPGNQAPLPAIVSNGYGNGRSLLFAFDLAAMVTADPQAGNAQLRDAMIATASHSANGTQTLTIGDLTALAMSVSNQGTRTTAVEVRASLPAGISHHSANIEPTQVQQQGGTTSVTWKISLGSLQRRELAWRVLARQPGVFELPVHFYSVPQRAGEVPRLLDTRSFTLTVQQPAQLVQDAQAQVQALQPAAASDKSKKTKAADAAVQAAGLHAQGRYQEAISQWLAAADALINIASADTTAARDAVAKALEASTDALCLAAP